MINATLHGSTVELSQTGGGWSKADAQATEQAITAAK
jgi:hypothetical protein